MTIFFCLPGFFHIDESITEDNPQQHGDEGKRTININIFF
jgi:hypothetical protein